MTIMVQSAQYNLMTGQAFSSNATPGPSIDNHECEESQTDRQKIPLLTTTPSDYTDLTPTVYFHANSFVNLEQPRGIAISEREGCWVLQHKWKDDTENLALNCFSSSLFVLFGSYCAFASISALVSTVDGYSIIFSLFWVCEVLYFLYILLLPLCNSTYVTIDRIMSTVRVQHRPFSLFLRRTEPIVNIQEIRQIVCRRDVRIEYTGFDARRRQIVVTKYQVCYRGSGGLDESTLVEGINTQEHALYIQCKLETQLGLTDLIPNLEPHPTW